MHSSRYNVVAESLEGRHLLYNTATGLFAEVSDEALKCLQEGEGASAGRLRELGFLTESAPEQELVGIRERFQAARGNRDALALSFVPTYACNYRCPYCYEYGHNSVKGKMDDRVMRAILDFVDSRYQADRFARLSVQWYGGDPSLALDVVEVLSEQLMAWCDARDVSYDAMMLTNANLIDEAAAAMLARCRVRSVYLTVDGPEELHNRRRIAADGSNSYERTMHAARALRAQGIALTAGMNVDKVSWELYPDLRDKLLAEEGITLQPAKLCDYGHFYGQAPFAAPDFDLFTHEEFFQAQVREFAARPHTADEMQALLQPIERFCSGQLNNYFIIDVLGDVYKCDGRVGDKEYVLFNLFDDPSAWRLADVVFDATHDEKCSACEMLPVCYGSCYWERACNGMPCHPFKTTMADYLRIYRSCFSDDALAAEADGVRLLG